MNAKRHSDRKRPVRPTLEGLEGRQLMAIAYTPVAALVTPLVNPGRTLGQPVAAVAPATGSVAARSSLQATSLILTVTPSKNPPAGSRVTFTATLTTADRAHTPLAHKTLVFDYTGGRATLTTNGNGQASITLTTAKRGFAVIVKVTFQESKPYQGNTAGMQVVSK